jgi:hypothetical protein
MRFSFSRKAIVIASHVFLNLLLICSHLPFSIAATNGDDAYLLQLQKSAQKKAAVGASSVAGFDALPATPFWCRRKKPG